MRFKFDYIFGFPASLGYFLVAPRDSRCPDFGVLQPTHSPTMEHLIVRPYPSTVGTAKHKIRITESMNNQQRVLNRMRIKSGKHTAHDFGLKAIFFNLLMKIPKSHILAPTQPFPTNWIRKHKYPNARQPHNEPQQIKTKRKLHNNQTTTLN